MIDILDKLNAQRVAPQQVGIGGLCETMRKAADEIVRLRARVAELEKELEDLSKPMGPLPPKRLNPRIIKKSSL